MEKFKVGDRVKCIGVRNDAEDEGQGWKKGHIFKITSIRYGVAFGGINGSGVFLNYIELVKRGRPAKEAKTMFVVTYDENDVDPHKTFTNKKELMKWLKDVIDNEDIDFNSIKVYEVKKEFKVVASFRLK